MFLRLRMVDEQILASIAVWGSWHTDLVDDPRTCGLNRRWAAPVRHDGSVGWGQTTGKHDEGDIAMTDLPAPRAARLQRPGWRDARFVVGLLLVLTSVALGSFVVAHADDRTPVYAARGPLVPGQRLEEDSLVRVDVQLGSELPRYLSAARGLAPEQYVLREVGAGELIPAAAVGGKDQVGVQPLTLSIDSGSAAALRVGSRVDVYVNPADRGATSTGKAFTGPELALEGVSVSSLPRTSSGLGGGSSGDRPIQVMAPTAQIKEIIAKVDLGARVTVVPVAGTPLRVDQ
jgi:hypothetical protein